MQATPLGAQADAPGLKAMCGSLVGLPTPDGRVLCTHGPDPAPDGVDFRVPRPLVVPGQAEGRVAPERPGDGLTKAAATPGIACEGDGASGKRVQAIYAAPADRADRYSEVLPSIRQWAAEMDASFQQSAAQTGGARRVRFVTDTHCDLVVTRVRLSAQGDDTFENTITELSAQGYTHSDRKYVVWMDSTALCGIGSYFVDDRPGADNLNNGNPAAPGSVARVDAGCWGLASQGQSTEAHELMHSLGAVLPTAPHATPTGLCSDDADRMCYADGSPLLVLRSVCGANQEALFDCGHDDHFHTAPPAGSYLATHWDAANSAFLSATSSAPLVSIADSAAAEGDSGLVPLAFALSLSAPASRPVTVRFATADGAARAPGDYEATSGALTFKPGESAKTVTVMVRGDLVEEVDEPFSLVLTSPANALLDRAQALGTILDNEPTAQDYRSVAADGGIFAFQSSFFGSTGSVRLNQPVVGMAATPTGKGYWFVAADRGIFAYGDAGFFGSTGGNLSDRPIVGMAATPTGKGYWFVAAGGAIFAFGDAKYLGSPASVAQPVAAMAPTPTGGGYWVVASNGGVSAFGDARSFGSTGSLNQPVVGMVSTPKGGGYWLVARYGGIFSFGDARYLGSTGDLRLNLPIVGMTTARRLQAG